MSDFERKKAMLFASSLLTVSMLISVSNAYFANSSALFDTLGPVAIIISSILTFYLAGLASIRIVCGSKGRGFAFGWKVHSLFNWKFYYGDVL